MTEPEQPIKHEARPAGSRRHRKPRAPDQPPPSLLMFMLQDPASFVLELWDAIEAWRYSREWRRMLWFLPAFMLLAVCGSAVLWGSFRSKTELLKHYVQLAENDFPIDRIGSVTGESSTEEDRAKEESAKNQYSELIYRRILQLESNNPMARYYVAAKMANNGNVPQARIMMQELAPDKKPGYPPAHSWNAIDLIQRAQFGGESLDQSVLLHHLEQAVEWEKCPTFLTLQLASLLKKESKVDEAIRVLRQRVAEYPEFRLAIAEIAAEGNPELAERELTMVKEHFSKHLGTAEEKEEDRIRLADAYILSRDMKSAKEILEAGLRQNKNRPQLIRKLSDTYIDEYRTTIRKTEKGVEPNLELLNNCALIDPGNPRLGEEIAQLVAAGGKADSSTMQALMDQIGTGQTSAVAHLIIADYYLSRKEIGKAVGHWEISLVKNPNMLLALRNLSLTLLQNEKPDYKRAYELNERAIRIAGEAPDLLDTRGSIYLAAGRNSEAIAEFEKAIKIQPARLETREKIVKAYQAQGLDKEAEAQQKMIVDIRKKIEEYQAQLKQKEEAREKEKETAASSSDAATQLPKP